MSNHGHYHVGGIPSQVLTQVTNLQAAAGNVTACPQRRPRGRGRGWAQTTNGGGRGRGRLGHNAGVEKGTVRGRTGGHRRRGRGRAPVRQTTGTMDPD
jgi:hypothetical protein